MPHCATPRVSRSLRGAASALLAVAGLACAGGAGLEQALSPVAPGFRASAPASGEAELGRHLVGDQPATNRCFDGTGATEAPVWDALEVRYTSATDAQLRADFGRTLTAEAGGGPRGTIVVRLGDAAIHRLDELYVNPSAACGEFVQAGGYLQGREERVITRAIRAGAIEVRKETANAVGVRVNVAIVGGRIAHRDETRVRWEGTDLYVARYAERVRVRRLEVRDRRLAAGQSLAIGPCALALRAVQAEGWDGTLSCRGGERVDLTGPLGVFVNWRSAPGVSYALFVERAGVALARVDAFQFVVQAVR